VSEFREVLYVLDDSPVGWGAVEGHENFVVHGTSMYSAYGWLASARGALKIPTSGKIGQKWPGGGNL
jgi:hypothetical protein